MELVVAESVQDFGTALFLCWFHIVIGESKSELNQSKIDHLKQLLQKYHVVLKPYSEDLQNQTHILSGNFKVSLPFIILSKSPEYNFDGRKQFILSIDDVNFNYI